MIWLPSEGDLPLCTFQLELMKGDCQHALVYFGPRCFEPSEDESLLPDGL